MTLIALNGCNGRMGKVLADLISKRSDCRVVYGIDINKDMAAEDVFPVFSAAADIPAELRADVIIDFSHPSAVRAIVDYAIKTKTPIVIATTVLRATIMNICMKRRKKLQYSTLPTCLWEFVF